MPAPILKRCAEQLAKPLQIPLLRLLETAKWCESWCEHWIVPSTSRRPFFSAGKYRGAHMTAQWSKVAERLVLDARNTVRQHERSRCRGRVGLSRDVLSSCARPTEESCCPPFGCLRSFRQGRGREIAGKNSDSKEFTLPWSIWWSWLQQRSAQVVVEGQRSDKMLLRNMVFQGTVLGPTLWTLSISMPAALSRRRGSWKSSTPTT